MRAIAPGTIALAAPAGCPAPPVTGPAAGPEAEDGTTAGTRTAGVLPAGPYFRNGYLRCATAREWPDPTCAAALGPFADEAAADGALRHAGPAAAAPGYPLVLHTDAGVRSTGRHRTWNGGTTLSAPNVAPTVWTLHQAGTPTPHPSSWR